MLIQLHLKKINLILKHLTLKNDPLKLLIKFLKILVHQIFYPLIKGMFSTLIHFLQ